MVQFYQVVADIRASMTSVNSEKGFRFTELSFVWQHKAIAHIIDVSIACCRTRHMNEADMDPMSHNLESRLYIFGGFVNSTSPSRD